MENVVVGRIVHLYGDAGENTTTKCRPFIITDVHQPNVVSGQLLLSPFDTEPEDLVGPDRSSMWVTSVVEEQPKGHQTPPREEDHVSGLWHDPRLC